jgi:putative heme-binding domain-containing protein
MAAHLLSLSQDRLAELASSDSEPLVRAEALRRLANPEAKSLLLKTLESDDPFLQQAARRGLAHSTTEADRIALAGETGFSAPQRLGLLLILRESDTPEARLLVPRFLADSDPQVRLAAIQWVGEAKLAEYRETLKASLASSDLSGSVFEGTLAALELLDGRSRGPRDEVSGEDYIAALLTAPGTPPAVVARALSRLRPDHPALTLDRLEGWLSSADPDVRIEAVRTLRSGSLPGHLDLLNRLIDDTHAPADLRAEAILGLAENAATNQQRLLALAQSSEPAIRREAIRSLRGTPLADAQRAQVDAATQGDEASVALAQQLGPDSPDGQSGSTEERPTRTDLDAWLARLEGPADPAAGARVFFQPKGPGCYRCHRIDGRGGRAGPELSTIAPTLDRRRLIQSILEPSREVAPQYVSWSVARADGTIFTGILLDESPAGELTFADPEGRLTVVKASEIDERKPLSQSIMPDGLERILTVQELRDLLAYLRSRP